MTRRDTFRTIYSPLDAENEANEALVELVNEMYKSVYYWMRAEFRKREDDIVSDASPSVSLEKKLNKAMRKWYREFDDLAESISKRLIDEVDDNVIRRMQSTLKASGFTVKLKNTRTSNSVIQASIHEYVSLIESIPEYFHDAVEGIANRAVQNGRDLGFFTDELDKLYDITRRRAELIASDQTNKATQAIARQRWQDLGIKKGIWVHNSGGSKTFRETHVHFDGMEFNLDKGLYDESVEHNVLPASEPFCKCTFRAKIPDDIENG